jgi:23S rRNA (cytosine1962-C5)-methyltransferase
MIPILHTLTASGWKDYELLDSGNGAKLERFGPFKFIRPEHQAAWLPRLSAQSWDAAHGIFQATAGEETGGRWQYRQPVDDSWVMHYQKLTFLAQSTSSRHFGVFPEQSVHWDWIASQIKAAGRPLKVLNLFGYTGLATLAAAQAGASITHVDASKKSVAWARKNQELSNLEDRPIRWIVDDALKFIQRENRRGVKYDGIIMDPPKFGRGPKGEIWEFSEMLSQLLSHCCQILHPDALFVVITAYAIRASALSLYYAVDSAMQGWGGSVECGELVTLEQSAQRALSMAIYTRWFR